MSKVVYRMPCMVPDFLLQTPFIDPLLKHMDTTSPLFSWIYYMQIYITRNTSDVVSLSCCGVTQDNTVSELRHGWNHSCRSGFVWWQDSTSMPCSQLDLETGHLWHLSQNPPVPLSHCKRNCTLSLPLLSALDCITHKPLDRRLIFINACSFTGISLRH